jgi:hypothetical protein
MAHTKTKRFTGCAYCRKAVLTRNQECPSTSNPTGICESTTPSKPPAYKSTEYMRELGRRRWQNVPKKKKTAMLSKAAKMSHKVNNPSANRDGYNGGRRPQE